MRGLQRYKMGRSGYMHGGEQPRATGKCKGTLVSGERSVASMTHGGPMIHAGHGVHTCGEINARRAHHQPRMTIDRSNHVARRNQRPEAKDQHREHTQPVTGEACALQVVHSHGMPRPKSLT